MVRAASAERWPASMRAATAAAYLDVSEDYFRRLNLPCIQHVPRGERYWMREDLDAHLESRRRDAVLPARDAA